MKLASKIPSLGISRFFGRFFGTKKGAAFGVSIGDYGDGSFSPLAFSKPEGNPIMSARPENDWESWQVFNPGVISLRDAVHFLYRAIGSDGQSRLGYARSTDGYKIDDRLDYPVYEHGSLMQETCDYRCMYFPSGGSWGGCEDPRIVKVEGDSRLYVTYTACDSGLRVALTSIEEEDFLARKWRWSEPKLISKAGEVHKNWVIFPEKINGKYAILHSISPKVLVAYTDTLDFEQDECIESYYDGGVVKGERWDNWIRGAGPPPLKTKDGWLLFYHAMDRADPGKYKVGAMLLALDDPTRIIARSPEPVLEPNCHYENNGFKGGVVYAVGLIEKNGNIMLYYGGADSHVCVAEANYDEFLDALKSHRKPKLKKEPLKKKAK